MYRGVVFFTFDDGCVYTDIVSWFVLSCAMLIRFGGLVVANCYCNRLFE